MIFSQPKIKILIALFLLGGTQSGFGATASEMPSPGLAVRDEATSETEFQALTRAHGRISFSDRVLKSSDLLISDELGDLFQQRLIEAQSEWLKTEGSQITKSTIAIDQFLSLAHLADWSATEREAFRVFSERRNKLQPEMRSSQNDSARYVSSSHLASFLASLPTDVVFVLINGEPVFRHSLASVKFDRSTTRVTLISNVFEPTTVVVRQGDTDGSLPERKPWIRDDCSIGTRTSSLVALDIAALGVGRCSSIAHGIKTTDDTKKAVNFGLVSGSTPLWPEHPPEESKSVFRRPWFWGVLGAIAVGAVVAIEQSQNKSTVRPTNHDGW